MPLQINEQTYLTPKESAAEVGLALQTFHNYRSERGDDWLHAHTDLIAGRTFYRIEDVGALAAKRGAA